MKHKVEIYTDGSHVKSKITEVTYGAVLVIDGEKKCTLSGTIDVIKFHKLYDTYVSNPTAEIYAAAVVLKHIRNLKDADITIYSDYTGVQEWISGRWKAKKKYIADLVSVCRKYINDTMENGSIITLEHVKGHSGNKFNEVADQLCKVKDHDTFEEFIERLNIAEKQAKKPTEEVSWN